MTHRISTPVRRAVRAALQAAGPLPVILLCAPAAAQQVPAAAPAGSPTVDQEIVVTGFRASVQSALDEKRNAIKPIETIVAEDIGKMPDQNVAESLQRLPGVAINRSGGHGTQVLIDGLQNNLVTLNGEVLLTGRELYSGGEASGGAGNIQYASLEGIPSEEIGGIDVIKNPTAQDREGGLGGIIDLKTRSPLSQKEGLNLSGNLRGTRAQGQDGGATPVATLVAGFKVNDSFAITASVSYDDEKTHDKQFQDQNRNQWLVTNTATVGSYVGSPVASTNTTLPGGQTYIDPQLAYFSDIFDRTKVKGGTLGAEWRWNEAVTSSLNYFYIGEDQETFTYSNKAWFSGGSGETNNPGAPASFPGIDPSQPYSIDANGVIQSATMMANGAETATLYEKNTTKAHNVQFATRFDSGALRGDVGAFYAKATADQQDAQADVEHGFYGAFHGPASIQPGAPGCNNGSNSCANGNHGYAFIYNNGGNSGLPSVSYPNNYGYTDVLSNPAYTLFKSNWAWANKLDEKNWALKGNLLFKPARALELAVGLRYENREADYFHGRYLINGVNPYGVGGVGAGTPAGNCCIGTGSGTWLYYSDPGYATIPYSTPQTNPDLLMTVNNFASGPIAVKNPYTGGMTNPATYLNTLWTQAGVPNTTEALFRDPLNSYDVLNKTTSAYVMGDAGDELYHINFGVRVVHNQITVEGAETNPNGSTFVGTASWNGVDANDVPFHSSRSYTDVLPTFNFVLNLSEQQKLRLGAARVLAPQNLNDLGRGLSYNFTRAAAGECPAASGGVCFKFAGGTAGNAQLDPFRASQFFAAWEDYFARSGLLAVTAFYKQVDNFVTQANVPTLVADGTAAGTTLANVQTLVNGGSGKVYGAELTAQYAWDSGFGVQANYTRAESTSTQNTTYNTNLPIPGVPKNSLNLVGYFERAGFSARLAYAWRDLSVNSNFVGSTFTFQDLNGNPRTYTIWQAPYGQLDGQVEYDFGEHFGVLFSVSNLTDEKQHTYLQWKNEPFTYDDTGRRFFVGVKARL
ncbi:MAG: TonB-dependent receptor [Gammaproteobacteria bacterium]|nr:TonB-dependent receptor [Gammaproteobacteria bacterium]MBV9696391.1 TonB-dependent receptor [Gammaproteobacteria bacterium]